MSNCQNCHGCSGIRIGVTERGDGGLDVRWADRLHTVSGAIVITKNMTDACANTILAKHAEGHKLMLHLGTTGWGRSIVEPGAPTYQEHIRRLVSLVDRGFPLERCVLRIDPIFPTPKGIKRVEDVLTEADRNGLFTRGGRPIRVRISILDEYAHVKRRFRELGHEPMYGDAKFAPPEMMDDVYDMIVRMADKYGIIFETCAEADLPDDHRRILRQGCVSYEDLRAMGIDGTVSGVNPQNRGGCLCLGCKCELLTNPRARCANRCAYCYWPTD